MVLESKKDKNTKTKTDEETGKEFDKIFLKTLIEAIIIIGGIIALTRLLALIIWGT